MSTTPTTPTPETGQPPQQRLTVLGPNLFGCPTEFRVHAEGCRDIAREARKYGGPGPGADLGWTGTFSSKGAVADDVYEFLGGEHSEDGDPTMPHDRCMAEFGFAPCVTLPDQDPDPSAVDMIVGPDEFDAGALTPGELVLAIRRFRADCVRDEYTDTGTAWELLDLAEHLADRIAEAVGQ